MLQRRTFSGGVVCCLSPLLEAAGVPHAFTTRIGGVSRPPFDSLNLGNPGGCEIQDEMANIRENYRRVLSAIGCADRERCRVHQVHGAAAARVRAGEAFDPSARADALVGDDPRRVLCVRVADCVPVLLASADGRRVAAVHAGWRGVVAGAVPSAIRSLLDQDGLESAGDLIAAIGPCIGPEAFEVGPEVAAEFERVFGRSAPIRARRDGKAWIDLRQAIRGQLLDAGVSDARIDRADRCTFRDADLFFSHRRDRGLTGRMAALIGPRR